MAQLTILYWRDIPAQVIAKAGRASVKRELSLRFTEAIDRAAMRSGASGSDDYLAQWRRGDPQPCPDDLEAAAAEAWERLEREFPVERLAKLAATGGREA
jgi:Virulence factor